MMLRGREGHRHFRVCSKGLRVAEREKVAAVGITCAGQRQLGEPGDVNLKKTLFAVRSPLGSRC